MSIFKDKTENDAFAGIRQTPHWPPRSGDASEVVKEMSGEHGQPPYAASPAEDIRPGYYDQPRNRMNVRNTTRPRFGHGY